MKTFAELTPIQKFIATLTWLEDDVYPDAFIHWAHDIVDAGQHVLDLESVDWFNEECET
jgi:hypothetical protein